MQTDWPPGFVQVDAGKTSRRDGHWLGIYFGAGHEKTFKRNYGRGIVSVHFCPMMGWTTLDVLVEVL